MKDLNLGERISKAVKSASKSMEERKIAMSKLPIKNKNHSSKYHS